MLLVTWTVNRTFARRMFAGMHLSELVGAVSGYLDIDIETRTVDSAIARLRRKIEIASLGQGRRQTKFSAASTLPVPV